ncbi:MAG: 4-hydroxy-tetrahydrodipicolinate synthase [Elusimicrobia bacterium]|nr:4-hydroxy-tetrahydrodipicolinate synthase [Elusimicrobiota bacterium]
MLRGCITALVTPFKNGEIDWKSFEDLVGRQLDAGVAGLSPCGTTGEAPALSPQEHLSLIKKVVEMARGRAIVVAGCGANSTKKTIELAGEVEQLGVDALLVVTPYYNRPTQKGLFEHYSALAKSVKTPICIYNVPARTGTNIEPATVLKLAALFQRIVAIKEAAGSLDQVSALVRGSGKGFSVLSGDDSLTLPMLSVGAVGVVSVVSNIAARELCDLISAWDQMDQEKARRLHLKLFPLAKELFVETNPAPVKWALKRLGLIATDELRGPLVSLSREAEPRVQRALQDSGLLELREVA